MQADQFRQLFRYHFAINQKIWDEAVSQLSDEQFTQTLPYSVGSIRNQLVHMAETELRWFSGLQELPPPPYSNPNLFPSKHQVQTLSDKAKSMIDTYLEELSDSALDDPFGSPPSSLKVWQVLFHVLSHGIDHRAQLLAMLNQFGIETFPQDYALYLLGRI